MAVKSGDYINVSPYADDKILEGDILVVIGNTEDIKKLEKSSGE